MLAHLGLPEDITNSVARWGNLGVAKSTWSSYRTARVMLDRCSKETGVSMDLTLDKDRILAYIDWLARVRGLKGGTIKAYLSRVRQLHVVRNLDPPELKGGFVRLVLKGIENRDGIMARDKNWAGRLPMTKNSMLLFKQLLRNGTHSTHDKALIWAVATIAFAGAFRIHELLAKAESTFDPHFTLLRRDITTTEVGGKTTIHIKLKCPKESRAAAAT